MRIAVSPSDWKDTEYDARNKFQSPLYKDFMWRTFWGSKSCQHRVQQIFLGRSKREIAGSGRQWLVDLLMSSRELYSSHSCVFKDQICQWKTPEVVSQNWFTKSQIPFILIHAEFYLNSCRGIKRELTLSSTVTVLSYHRQLHSINIEGAADLSGHVPDSSQIFPFSSSFSHSFPFYTQWNGRKTIKSRPKISL